MFSYFHYNASTTTFASKLHQNFTPFLDQKSTKMASKIDHQSYIDLNLDFWSILAPFWGRFGSHLGTVWASNGRTLNELSLFACLSASFLPPRRLGDPIRSHFGTILGPFWEQNCCINLPILLCLALLCFTCLTCFAYFACFICSACSCFAWCSFLACLAFIACFTCFV